MESPVVETGHREVHSISSRSIWAIPVPAVPGTDALSESSQHRTANLATTDAPCQRVYLGHHLMIRRLLVVLNIFQCVDVSCIHISERVCGEVDVFRFASPPLMKGGI
jgi:hypothetical protein